MIHERTCQLFRELTFGLEFKKRTVSFDHFCLKFENLRGNLRPAYLVGSIDNHQTFRLLLTDVRHEMLHFFQRCDGCTHSSQCQQQRTGPLQETFQILKRVVKRD